jgi:hypothetical protein
MKNDQMLYYSKREESGEEDQEEEIVCGEDSRRSEDFEDLGNEIVTEGEEFSHYNIPDVHDPIDINDIYDYEGEFKIEEEEQEDTYDSFQDPNIQISQASDDYPQIQ